MEEFNLHLTGDMHAVAAAHNLLAAFLDSSLHFGNPHGIDPLSVTWRRVVDTNDRALRQIVVGLGGKRNGIPRETGFDIVASSEVMAILALAGDIHDMRRRLGKVVVGYDSEGRPVTAEDFHVAGAMTVIMRKTIDPNLMQTLEGGPCLIHAGPFANIAHGNSSIIADRIALRLCDYVVTEAGFGADMGAEKFFDIKCRISGLVPDAVLLVVTVRSVKLHGGEYDVRVGRPLDPRIREIDLAAVQAGAANMERHIENLRRFGVPVVVALNRFPTDGEEEIALLRERALAAGAQRAVVSDVHRKGGAGGLAMAHAVVEATETPADFQFLYPLELSLAEKIERIAKVIYRAGEVVFEKKAKRKLEWFEDLGYGGLPICMAKTQRSFSHDPKIRGCPEGFSLPVRDMGISAGAGFVVPYCGDILTMPGLPSEPGGTRVDIDEHGHTVGLF
jgi:formate--tetrahydrofolate ligase